MNAYPIRAEKLHAPGNLKGKMGEISWRQEFAAAVSVAIVTLGPRVPQELLQLAEAHELHDHQGWLLHWQRLWMKSQTLFCT